jgi:maleylacetoacetate isomerase
MELYTYFRSSASYRVRIALALKGIAFDSIQINLLRDCGEQLNPAYRAINPEARMPALRLPDGQILIQSLAIIEYLEEVFPEPALLPKDPVQRAQARGVAAVVVCDMQPLGTLAVLKRLRAMGSDHDAVTGWINHWMGLGFAAVETLIGDEGWCYGPEPGLADVCLMPQIFFARRNEVPLEAYPQILRVAALAAAYPAFIAAEPDNQPDAE